MGMHYIRDGDGIEELDLLDSDPEEKIDFAAAGEADVVATVSAGVLRRWDVDKKK